VLVAEGGELDTSFRGEMNEILHDVGQWLEAAGNWAYVLAPLVMATVAILPIPAEAPAMLNGMLFGPVTGTAVSWTGAMIGAVASFEIARALGRPAAKRLVGASAIEKADRLVMSGGWQGLLLARLIPLIAFTALNWGAGLTRIDRWRFIWTTGLGIIPGAIVFTASGWGFAALLGRPWVTASLVGLILIVAIVRQLRRLERQPEAATPSE